MWPYLNRSLQNSSGVGYRSGIFCMFGDAIIIKALYILLSISFSVYTFALADYYNILFRNGLID